MKLINFTSSNKVIKTKNKQNTSIKTTKEIKEKCKIDGRKLNKKKTNSYYGEVYLNMECLNDICLYINHY